MSHLDLVADHSKEKLTIIPKVVLDMTNLKMLFLEGNFLSRLPDDVFWKLPRLMWLDLRNNILEYIPRSIAHHEHLENLLLTNNNLQALPNELGLVPKLKALQVSENPLVYPGRKILVEGTKTIKNYLRQQFEILHPTALPTSEEPKEDDEEEKVISIVETSSCDDVLRKSDSSSSKESVPEVYSADTKPVDPNHSFHPPFQIKKLLHPPNARKTQQEPLKIVHKVNRTGSKILLRSSFNRIRDPMRSDGKMRQKSLREGWLNQLRMLLTDQERILQQERNLRALSDWRKQKRETPKIFPQDAPPLKAPYGTHAAYEKMPSREELAAQLNSFFKEKGIVRANRGSGLDIDKLVNDLMQQLKDMESEYGDDRHSPRSRMKEAGKQIKTVMDIQKKLLSIKTANNSFNCS